MPFDGHARHQRDVTETGYLFDFHCNVGRVKACAGSIVSGDVGRDAAHVAAGLWRRPLIER